MAREIILFIAMLLIAMGLADIIGLFATRLFTYKREKSNLIIVPIDEEDDAEVIIRSVAYKYTWGRWDKDSKVICLYGGKNEETEKICKALCKSYPFIEYKKITDLGGIFKVI